MIDVERFRARYTPEFIKDLAMRGNDTLSILPRDELFGGTNCVLIWPRSDGSVPMVNGDPRRTVIKRASDYERVRFKDRESWDSVRAKADEAIVKLGRRAEAMLLGLTGAAPKDFSSGYADHGLTPVQRWEGAAALYSLGPMPRLLDCDGIVFLRVRPDSGEDQELVITGEELMAMGNERAEAKMAELRQAYGDGLYVGNSDAYYLDRREPTFELRFGYYGNTGPAPLPLDHPLLVQLRASA